MSAICGVITLDGAPVRREWLERMLEPLALIGPDRQRLLCQGNVGLGHCLLEVSPESALEQQPLTSEDRTLTLLFAGLLHRRQALAASLGISANEAGKMPDSFLVLRAYQSWGEDSLERLDGEFALAVADQRQDALLLAQSRIAAAPVYLVRTPHLFGFATRIVPLLSLPGVNKELDERGFVRAVGNFTWKEADLAATCFRDIESLLPATALWVGPKRWRRWTYWQPDPKPETEFTSEAEVHAAVRERMRASVRERVRSRHPVACMLSGGLDSSSITCLAAAEVGAGQSLVAISSALPEGVTGDAPDERPYIEIVRQHLQIPVEYITPPPSPSPWEFSDAFFARRETAVLSPRQYLYDQLIATANRHGARVLLDGAYGEAGPSAWGDGTVRALLRQRNWSAIAPELRFRAKNEQTSWARAARRHLLAPLLPSALRPTGRTRNRNTKALPNPLSAGFYAGLNADFLHSTGLQPAQTASQTATASLGRGSQGVTRISETFRWEKLESAIPGSSDLPVDVRFPFRDLELLEYCRGLPLHLAHREGWNRSLIRSAMAGILPEPIRWRLSKLPFSPDYYSRLRQTLPLAIDLCEAVPPGSLAAQLLDLPWLRQTLTACRQNPALLTLDVAITCQGTVGAIQFLDWFERLSPTRTCDHEVRPLRLGTEAS